MNIQANGIMIDSSGPVTALKLERIADFINTYKSNGVNTIILTNFVPVDPQSGAIRDQFAIPNPYGKVAVTPEYMASFTDLALGMGVQVIWKSQFIVDDGSDRNVNDYSLGAAFYPSGNGFSVQNFLTNVKEYWRQWSAVAEQHHVSMLVIGTEQGHFAYPPYSSAWREIIQTTRENFSGNLTYAENHFAPLPGEGRVDFWDALDYIGIDDYSPIGNGTDNTPYAQAYANVFNSSVFNYNTTNRLDVPGVLYNLHLKYDKKIFFTEFAIDSLSGAMNDPAASNFSKPINFSEQENYFRAKFDVYHNYDWVEGIGIFDVLNEASPSPSSAGWQDFFDRSLKNNMEWLDKPVETVIRSYWKDGALPPPIHASSATKPSGGFAGTNVLPDVLVGGFQNDHFDRLGGVYHVYGGGGFDVATYSGTSVNFTVTISNGSVTIVDRTGGEGSGILTSVEAILFADRAISGITGLALPDHAIASLSQAEWVVTEGAVGFSVLSFTVSLDTILTSPQTLTWEVAGSGAHPATSADFAGNSFPFGTVILTPGEISKDFTVQISADRTVEFDETFTVTLSNPSSGLTIGAEGQASATILNDDTSTVSLAPRSAAKAEGDGGTTVFTFTVSLDQPSVAQQSVIWTVSASGEHPTDALDFMAGLPSGTLIFFPGETSKTITVAIAGDTTVEFDEGFAVTLSNASGGLTLGTSTASATIVNDDVSIVSIVALSAIKPEGNSGTTSYTFTVSLSQVGVSSQTVEWAVTGTGAHAADAADFGGLLPFDTVSFAAGEISKTVTVLVSGDITIEFDEGFAVTVSNASTGLTLGASTASGTIVNDDTSTVSIAALSAAKAEEDSGAIPFTFTATLGQAGIATQTVDWTVAGTGDHPIDGADFVGGVLPSGTLAFAAGETSKTISLAVSGDVTVEFDEFFTVTLSNPSVGLALGTASAVGDIQNDDRAKISIVPLSARKAEGNSGTAAFTFTVSLDQASFAEQSAQWTVTGSGANAADAGDFGGAFPSATVTFAAGETSEVVTILVSGDSAAEFNEDFAVTLSNLTFGLQLGIASATGTILNDDKSVVLISAGPASKAEGTGGTTTFDWTVSLDRAGVTSETVAWAVTGTGARAADGADIAGGVLPSGTLTFAPGETSKTVSVSVVGDAVVEFDEGVVLTLSAPSSGLDLGTVTLAGTIVNDDVSVASIAAQAATKAEGNSGTTAFTFTVTLSQAGVTGQTVGWSVSGNGTHAADAADFGGVLLAGTVTFAAGETTKTLTVNVAGDTAAEFDETFLVTLSSPSAGIAIGVGTASGTIVDDDATVSIAALSAVKAEGNSGTTAFTFKVTVTGDTSAARSVAWAVTGSGASAASAADFAGGVLPSGVLTLAPGETTKVLTVNVAGDTTVESDEGFVVTLSNPSTGLTLGTPTASGTIQNDDSIAVTVSTHDDAYVVQQGQSLSIAASVGVLLNDQSASTATLLSGPTNGTFQLAATGGFSYTPATGFAGVDSFTYHAATGGSGADGQALLYVVPVQVAASTTLNLLALNAEEQIAATYAAFFGRASDAAGFNFWLGEFNRGLPVQGPAALFANIASSFGISAEAKTLYPFLVNPFGASDVQISTFLDAVYNNLFNRSSDPLGLAYWTGQIKATLQAGQFVGSVLVNIMSGAQDTAAGKDITTLMGKVAVSLDYVHQQEQHHTTWVGTSDTAAATTLMHAVTADPQTVLVGIKNAEALIAAHA
jgi:hypothetical protein